MRIVWGVAGAIATSGLIVTASADGTPWWACVLLWLVPDLGLIAGVGRDFSSAQLRPRAVPLYNALHHLHGPVLLGAAAAAGIVPAVLALAWASHVAVDRALGYGLRTPEGLQRA